MAVLLGSPGTSGTLVPVLAVTVALPLLLAFLAEPYGTSHMLPATSESDLACPATNSLS